MSAREDILASLRKSAKITAPESAAVVDERLAHPPRLFAATQSSVKDLTEAFCQQLTRHLVKVIRLDDASGIIPATLAYMQEHDIAFPIHVATQLKTSGQWPQNAVRKTPAGKDCKISLTPAFAGIAETGALVMISGSGCPTSFNFAPDHHLVVLSSANIYKSLEDVWPKIPMPLSRTMNLITGPSSTADIEQTLVQGVHGPRSLLVFLLP